MPIEDIAPETQRGAAPPRAVNTGEGNLLSPEDIALRDAANRSFNLVAEKAAVRDSINATIGEIDKLGSDPRLDREQRAAVAALEALKAGLEGIDDDIDSAFDRVQAANSGETGEGKLTGTPDVGTPVESPDRTAN